MVPYDGSKSHIPTYNFCYLCKDRLDTYHDDQDEGWYFVDARQVRFTAKNGTVRTASAGEQPQPSVVNCHTTCLKEIEELNFSSEVKKPSVPATEKDPKLEIPVAGQKRTYVNAQQEE
jgi:hypothetical protein